MDPLKKVQPGERLEIPADAYNAFIDAVHATRANRRLTPPLQHPVHQLSIVLAKNTTGVSLARYSIVSLGPPINDPTSALDAFKNRPIPAATVPSTSATTTQTRLAITFRPAKPNALVPVTVSGLTPARLLVDGILYDAAEPVHAVTTYLRTVPHGPIAVLWAQPSGNPRWALVRLDAANYEEHVLITSNTKDDNGYYSGQVQRYDPTTKTWLTKFPCKVLDVND